MEKPFLSNKNMPEKEYENRIIRGMYVNNPIWQYVVFVPLILLTTIYSLFWLKMAWWGFLLGFSISIAFWTVFEYASHRYFFHANPSNKWIRKILDSVHWAHHEYPKDNRIMLVNPLISLPVAALVYAIFYGLIGNYAYPFITGVMAIYLLYDWFHFASHNKNYNNWWFQLMKRHHMKHHYQDDTQNYGFTSTIWDKILSTEITTEHGQKREVSASEKHS